MVTRVRSNLLLLLCVLLFASPIRIIAMASDSPSSSSTATVHIVYTEKPHGEDPEAYHIQTLSTVLGSEEAAKGALLYTYKSAASGFSAKLTPQQVAQISKLPGVLQVVPSETLHLHSGPTLD